MAKVTIEFEISDKSEIDFGANSIEDTLHEALCLMIHEGDEDALDWVCSNVINISAQ